MTYRLVTGPAAATWTGNQLRWSVSAADVGVHGLLMEVADTAGNVTQQSWQLEVIPASGNQPPAITSSPKVTAAAGGVYEYQVVASDRDGDALSYALVSAPTGMTISSTGKVAWAVLAGFASGRALERVCVRVLGMHAIVNFHAMSVLSAAPPHPIAAF